jgi:hypothetical protein
VPVWGVWGVEDVGAPRIRHEKTAISGGDIPSSPPLTRIRRTKVRVPRSGGRMMYSRALICGMACHTSRMPARLRVR